MVNEKSSLEFVNIFDLKQMGGIFSKNVKKDLFPIKDIENGYTCDKLLSVKEAEYLLNSAKNNKKQPVGVTGYLSEYKSGDIIGSYRSSIYNQKLADIIFERIKAAYPSERSFINNNIDYDNSNDWVLSGVNPLFRFINYEDNGMLVPHYDAPYIKDKNERTLVTLIIYLTTNLEDGATRFIKDKQSNITSSEKNFEDWKRLPFTEEIMVKVNPSIGNALLFDHRILHDSEKTIKNKMIIRTDLFFKRGLL